MIIPGQFGFNYPSGFREEAYGENDSKRFFSETTRTVETKLPRNDHWRVLYKVSVFGIKNTHLVDDLPMIIPGQFGFNCPSGFREEAFYQTAQEWSLEGSLQSVCFLCRLKIQDGRHRNT
jgi:hypothetical protein